MALTTASVLSDFSDGLDFLVHQRESVAGGVMVGGSKNLPLLGKHLEVVGLAMLLAVLVAVPLGLYLGHTGRGSFLASSISNVGRSVPAIALVLFFSSYLGLELKNLVFAMTLLAIPPIFTNTYVGVRQVDGDVVDAARGMGLSGTQVVRRVELPLALPLVFGGIRTSVVNVIATATLGPFAGVLTLGDPIINASVYGDAGRVGTAMLVAGLAVGAEILFALLQRAVTPAPLRPARGRLRAGRPARVADAAI
ncbi:ABC transporter permease [Paraconexibacter antarcticus]|uniref:ABC transporter permease n=1 Tax=Paraconexibacter antarcticus TaxID=2949664 RepID=A0ABY5DLR6_9ACTN|nr:ABC transporter permease [Paraconexibacter antarcticus]UTI62810.1 ABC transporter permease [Paraconexibacter antarcticus]